MTPRKARIDLQISKPKLFSFINRLRTRHWFAGRGENICACFFAESWQVRDVIGMRVREQDQLHIELVALRRTQHLFAIGSSIESCCHASRWVPNKICVNGHAVVIGRELREPLQRFDFLWMPFAARNLAKGAPIQAKNRRNLEKSRFVEVAVTQLPNCLRIHSRLFGQLGIGNSEAALCLSDDVGGVIFEWNHGFATLKSLNR